MRYYETPDGCGEPSFSPLKAASTHNFRPLLHPLLYETLTPTENHSKSGIFQIKKLRFKGGFGLWQVS